MATPPPLPSMFSRRSHSQVVGVAGWGCAQLPIAEIGQMRRKLPSFAPPETPNNFFKYADEQTLLAVRAVENLLERGYVSLNECQNWSILAAPQFLGRCVTAQAVNQFQKMGGRAISPHIIPQHSLHSVSGALSILLKTHGANVGIGGGSGSFTDGLLAAVTMFDLSNIAGCWFVATSWAPEPLPHQDGQTISRSVCHAVAFALQPIESCRQLLGSLELCDSPAIRAHVPDPVSSVAEFAARLQQLELAGGSEILRWPFPWGAEIRMSLKSQSGLLRHAA